MTRFFIHTLLLAACTGTLHAQGGIEGAVTLTGRPMGPPPTAHYALNAGQVAASPKQLAVVYLEVPGAKQQPPGQPLVMVQRGYQFAPGVLAVQTGTQVVFPNNDSDYHNVFSFSKTKRFDLGRFRKDETPPALTFDKAGVVRLYCEIHQHMRGVILVLDTPHFAITDADGRYRLSGLPAGTWQLKAWLDEKTTIMQDVTVTPGKTLRVDFAGVRTASTR
ncbi:carboxypeptidase regulatory-like domain-containing protein [Prosthecobacter sp.]|uniref:carboxypeptidase regulatory-like domain-containing protein n=1 Tax=Prosthecobacter sp. TaxID=1965333 RepID=UPI002ABB8BE3|nr:carboxypeptidase regulatory-like domain-containing protein [Prosthecobacter sp.]MDZ4405243.1 carboxypeptidase regulatory-like domain-containing protein [Prosthecobacter sp.]